MLSQRAQGPGASPAWQAPHAAAPKPLQVAQPVGTLRGCLSRNTSLMSWREKSAA